MPTIIAGASLNALYQSNAREGKTRITPNVAVAGENAKEEEKGRTDVYISALASQRAAREKLETERDDRKKLEAEAAEQKAEERKAEAEQLKASMEAAKASSGQFEDVALQTKREELNMLLKHARLLSPRQYTAKSWGNFVKKMQEALKLSGSEEAAALDKAIKALQAGLQGLRYAPKQDEEGNRLPDEELKAGAKNPDAETLAAQGMANRADRAADMGAATAQSAPADSAAASAAGGEAPVAEQGAAVDISV